MTSPDRTRFDVSALRKLAGDKAFARGQAYDRDGQVEIVAIEPQRILAQVAGAEIYRTELTGRDGRIAGTCSCPAFPDWGFCKHMVAAALAANAAGSEAEAEGAGALARIREHLRQRGIDALVDMILGLADRDPALFRKLDMAAAAVGADDDRTLGTRLRRAIDQATHTGDSVEYREAASWVAGVDAALDSIAEIAAAGRGALALDLVGRAIERIEQAAASIDDSDGGCGALLLRCRDIHLAAARVSDPDPIQFARDLFAREMNGAYDVFDGAAAFYADVLGDVGLAEYRRLATEAWAKVPPRSAKTRPGHVQAGNEYRLVSILDVFAEREGDVDARIALRAKDLSSPWATLRLAKFCLSQDRPDEALRRAQDGLWLFEDGGSTQQLVSFTAGLLTKASREAEAETLLQRAFEKAPSLDLYGQLCRLSQRGRDRAIEVLQKRLGNRTPNRSHGHADLLIRILTQERAFEQAWATVRGHGASAGVKEALARASDTAHPREAVEVYAERVDQLVEGGGDRGYADAAALIGRMAVLRSPAEQATYLATLKVRLGRRRNLMKLLE